MGKRETELMLDLEFVGLPEKGPCPVIAIGAVAMDMQKLEVVDTFYTQVNLQSEVDAGAPIQADTFLWWLRQLREARKAFFDNEKAPAASEALTRLVSWANSANAVAAWGNGATADNHIIATMAHRHRFELPWDFRGGGTAATAPNWPNTRSRSTSTLSRRVAGTTPWMTPFGRPRCCSGSSGMNAKHGACSSRQTHSTANRR